MADGCTQSMANYVIDLAISNECIAKVRSLLDMTEYWTTEDANPRAVYLSWVCSAGISHPNGCLF